MEDKEYQEHAQNFAIDFPHEKEYANDANIYAQHESYESDGKPRADGNSGERQE